MAGIIAIDNRTGQPVPVFGGGNMGVPGNPFQYQGGPNSFGTLDLSAYANPAALYNTGMAGGGAQGGYGGYGGAGGYGQGQGGAGSFLQQLLQLQLQENQRAEGLNQGIWNDVRGMLTPLLDQYNSNPLTQGAEQIAQGILQNPESITEAERNQMLARQRGEIDQRMAAARQAALEQYGGAGYDDAATAAGVGLQTAIGASGQASGARRDMDIYRSQQRRADQLGAINMGTQLAANRTNIPLGVAQTYANASPQYQPMDFSGLAVGAGLAGQNGGGGFQVGGNINNQQSGYDFNAINQQLGNRYPQPGQQSQQQGNQPFTYTPVSGGGGINRPSGPTIFPPAGGGGSQAGGGKRQPTPEEIRRRSMLSF